MADTEQNDMHVSFLPLNKDNYCSTKADNFISLKERLRKSTHLSSVRHNGIAVRLQGKAFRLALKEKVFSFYQIVCQI